MNSKQARSAKKRRVLKTSLSPQVMARAVQTALAEDVGRGDMTTRAIVPGGKQARATIEAQGTGLIAGVPVVREVFRQLDRRIRIKVNSGDGAVVQPGDAVLTIRGPAAAILTGERTALNFLSMLSGIATAAGRFVMAVTGTNTRIYDTRKTAPGLRDLVKYAVRVGGGTNHRRGLDDAFLIKDNHIRFAGSVTEAIRRVKARNRARLPIEVEVENLRQLQEALAAGADIILLDNLTPPLLKRAVTAAHGRALLEVSGNIDRDSAHVAATLGVERVSVGAMTHSAAWLPFHLEFD